MRRVTAACGSMEAKFPTKMEKKDFDQQMDNINRGYQITLSFVDESGATGNGGDYGIMPQPTDAQAALDRLAETVLGPGWHVPYVRRSGEHVLRRRGGEEVVLSDEMPVPQADGVVTGRATSPPLFFCKIKKERKS